MGATPPQPLYRWAGQYWGFLEDDRLYDRYGRQRGWLMPAPGRPPDVFDLGGHFLGELVEGRHVLRYRLRAQPVPRAARAGATHPVPPEPWPDLDPRDPRDDWTDALPWPLPPPDPPRR